MHENVVIKTKQDVHDQNRSVTFILITHVYGGKENRKRINWYH